MHLSKDGCQRIFLKSNVIIMNRYIILVNVEIVYVNQAKIILKRFFIIGIMIRKSIHPNYIQGWLELYQYQ